MIAGVRHCGGGSLVLADAAGEVAAAELLQEGARIDRAGPAFRSNHFWCEDPAAVRARLAPAALRSTLGRRDTLAAIVAGAWPGAEGDVAAAMRALADHGDEGREALCRHGGEDGAHTVSGVIYLTRDRAVAFARGAPCLASWEFATLAEMISRGEP